MNSVDKTDFELISDYLSGNDKAFEFLMRRHYNQVHKRFLSITGNRADADDLSQKLWLKILQFLPKYEDKQKFPQFVSKVATNLIRDQYSSADQINTKSIDSFFDDQENEALDIADQLAIDPGDISYYQSEIAYLTQELIPNLKPNLRTVFLLRHEAEFWDSKTPLQWQHLAELHNMEVAEAAQMFVNSRDHLLISNADKKNDVELDWQEKSVFLAWTQSQRFDKSIKQTESYLAKLLKINVNTFKTHYRSALSELNSGMGKWRNAKGQKAV